MSFKSIIKLPSALLRSALLLGLFAFSASFSLTPSTVVAQEAAEMREWTDSTGSYKIQAKFLSNKNGKIELEKEDGRVITLPAVKLSDKDQGYLKALQEAAAAEADENNPFAGGKKKVASGPRPMEKSRPTPRKTRTSPSANTPVTVLALNNSIVLSGSGWKVEPDPALEATTSNKIIDLSTNMTKHAFHNKVSPLLSPGKKFMGTSISNPFEKKTEIMAIDLVTGKSTEPITIDSKDSKVFAISDDGKTIVTFLKGRGADRGRLDFWDTSQGSASKSASWYTAGFHDRDGFAPNSGRFISPSRLLTIGRSVVLWDCETTADLYSFNLAQGSSPVLSPGGNQLAVPSENSIYFVSVKDGQVLGEINATDEPVQRVAYSQSGRFLAGMNQYSGEIWVWDLTNQELVRQFSAPGGSGSSIQWCGDKYVLINGSFLMDVELRATVWNYSSTGGNVVNGHDGRFWFVSKSKLTPIKLPHKNLDAKTAKFDPDDLLLLKPGSEVSIKLETSFAPSEERNIREELTSALKAQNIDVVDKAELEIVGKVKKQKQKTVEVSSMFNRFGRRGNSEKITYTPNLATLHLVKNGKNLWGKTRSFSPGAIIHSNSNESTQQAATRLCKPKTSFFTAMKFPRYISQLPPSDPPGTSKITAAGVQ